MRTLPRWLFLLSTIYAAPALAGAWTQAKGTGEIIVNNWYYQADSRFTNGGSEVSQPTYRKFDLNPYIEYGLTDDITLGANLSLQRVSQNQATGTAVNWGIGDSEFFARFKLWQQNGWVVSAEPLVKLASPSELTDQPPIGGDDPDAGLALAAGYGFEAYGRSHYITADAGYRYRFGSPENQLRFSFTAGLGVANRWQILPQLFITRRTDSPSAVTFTQSSADDFNLTKIQISTVYQYQEDISFQIGAFSHIDGTNAGAGEGALLAIWKRF